MGKIQRRVGRLSQKDGRHGHVNVGTIEVKAVARRDHQTDRGFRTAQLLEFFHDTGQRRLRGTGPQDQKEFVLDVCKITKQGDSRKLQDQSQHQHHEDARGQIKPHHQGQELVEGSQAITSHRVPHGPEGPDRRCLHHDAHHPKEKFSRLLHDLEDGPTPLGKQGDGQGGEDGDEENLQQVARGEGPQERGRNDVQEKVRLVGSVRFGEVSLPHPGIQRAHIQVESLPGPENIHHHQADHQGKGGNDLEVEEGFPSRPAQPPEIPHRGDAVDHRAENDRGDHHLDQLDEGVPQRF